MQITYLATPGTAGLAKTVFSGTNIYGAIAFMILVVQVVMATEPIRRKAWNVFKAFHFLYFAWFVLGGLHAPNDFSIYAVVAAGIYGLDIIIRLITGTAPKKTTLLEARPGGITRVRFPKSNFAKAFKMHKVGQYMFLNFPGLNFFEWHPFSVTSAPQDDEVEFNIRALGNYTTALNELAQNRQRLYVRAEGPYGDINLNYRRFPFMLLVCGGIGITPVMGIIRDCFSRPHKKRALHTVYCIWSIPSEENYGWFSDVFQGILDNNNQSNTKLILRVQVSRAQNELAPPLYSGRANMKEIMDEIGTDPSGGSCFVFVCGPPPMVQDCWDQTTRQKRKGRPFVYHHEIFEF